MRPTTRSGVVEVQRLIDGILIHRAQIDPRFTAETDLGGIQIRIRHEYQDVVAGAEIDQKIARSIGTIIAGRFFTLAATLPTWGHTTG